MVVNKYLELCMFNLVLYILCLAIIVCTEVREDKHLQDLDDRNDWWNKYQTTQEPFDEKQNRWDWIKPASQEDSFDFLGLFFAVLIFVLIPFSCALLKYLCGKRNRNYYDRLLAASDSGQSISSQQDSVPTISCNITPERHFILEIRNPVSDLNSIVLAADQPPRYDEVVIGDLIAEGNYSGVNSAIPDTPPPQYDDNIPPRYYLHWSASKSSL